MDPDGRIIKIYFTVGDKQYAWSFNGSNYKTAPDNQFVKDFLKAYDYNKRNGGGDNLIEAATSKDTYHLAETKGDSKYTQESIDGSGKSTPIVRWNPARGLETTDMKAVLSPATILEHEYAHAVDDNENSTEHEKRANIPDFRRTNKEEDRVITGAEAKTARANGEFKSNYVRSNHDGYSVFVSDPTSNEVIFYYEIPKSKK